MSCPVWTSLNACTLLEVHLPPTLLVGYPHRWVQSEFGADATEMFVGVLVLAFVVIGAVGVGARRSFSSSASSLPSSSSLSLSSSASRPYLRLVSGQSWLFVEATGLQAASGRTASAMSALRLGEVWMAVRGEEPPGASRSCRLALCSCPVAVGGDRASQYRCRGRMDVGTRRSVAAHAAWLLGADTGASGRHRGAVRADKASRR